MSGLNSNPRPRATRYALLVAVLAIASGHWQAGTSAHAGAIHHKSSHAVVTAESATVSAEAVMNSWEPYFAEALKTHQMHVRGPNAVKLLTVLVAVEGGLPRNSFVEYLEWRHDLNRVRFDAFHPLLGPMLEKLHFVTTEASTPPILPSGLLPSPQTPLLPTTIPPLDFGAQSLGPPQTCPSPRPA